MTNCLCFEKLIYCFTFWTYILLSFLYIQALLMTKLDSRYRLALQLRGVEIVPEPTAQSAVPGVSPGRGY